MIIKGALGLIVTVIVIMGVLVFLKWFFKKDPKDEEEKK